MAGWREIVLSHTPDEIMFRSEISLPIMKELVPHYLQESGKERLDYLEDGKNIFKLRLRLCSSLYPVSERIRDFFLEYDRHTLRTSPPWGSELLEVTY
ncbi:MAP kinase Spk1 [Datura stramonium]|uniref:MAP kinase Spk1 n=1 Tax=Datura stramonium TaxID=4076 RepID=A0ABS8VFI3_DATST|nr:MAP kinase Spk1 [Datura stramonium]